MACENIIKTHFYFFLIGIQPEATSGITNALLFTGKADEIMNRQEISKSI